MKNTIRIGDMRKGGDGDVYVVIDVETSNGFLKSRNIKTGDIDYISKEEMLEMEIVQGDSSEATDTTVTLNVAGLSNDEFTMFAPTIANRNLDLIISELEKRDYVNRKKIVKKIIKNKVYMDKDQKSRLFDLLFINPIVQSEILEDACRHQFSNDDSKKPMVLSKMLKYSLNDLGSYVDSIVAEDKEDAKSDDGDTMSDNEAESGFGTTGR